MKIKSFLFSFAFLFMNIFYLHADMGAIVPIKSVSLDEPAQRAVIGFDGFEEILILQTELESTTSTKVLRFIPLPSKPSVKAGNKNIFENLKNILREHKLKYFIRYKSISNKQKEENVNIVLKKTIGSHNITVIHINSYEEFSSFINSNRSGFKMTYSLNENYDLRNIIEHYIKKKIMYFVFDTIDLTGNKTIDPVVYRFKTKKLYYPLVATNILKSYGTIELFIISETGRYYLTSSYRFVPSTTAVLNETELVKIDPVFKELLGKNAILQAFKYEGKLYFENDILESSWITEIY